MRDRERKKEESIIEATLDPQITELKNQYINHVYMYKYRSISSDMSLINVEGVSHI